MHHVGSRAALEASSALDRRLPLDTPLAKKLTDWVIGELETFGSQLSSKLGMVVSDDTPPADRANKVEAKKTPDAGSDDGGGMRTDD